MMMVIIIIMVRLWRIKTVHVMQYSSVGLRYITSWLCGYQPEDRGREGWGREKERDVQALSHHAGSACSCSVTLSIAEPIPQHLHSRALTWILTWSACGCWCRPLRLWCCCIHPPIHPSIHSIRRRERTTAAVSARDQHTQPLQIVLDV